MWHPESDYERIPTPEEREQGLNVTASHQSGYEAFSEALDTIREEFPEVHVTEYDPNQQGSRSEARLECSSDQDNSNTPSILHGWPAVDAMTEDSDEPVKIGIHFEFAIGNDDAQIKLSPYYTRCLLYTSPSPRDGLLSRMPSSA